jgi:cell division protein FtsN
VAFAVVVGILLILSFLWYWEPFPSVKRALERVLGEGAHPHPVATTADTGRAAPPAAASASGDWEYFVQISSWKAQYLAQDQANGFRSAGVPVVVDLAYVARQRAPRFRVRLGPYPTRAAALRVKDSLGPRIDRGSFVDSVSLSGPAPVGRPPDHRPPAPQPVERPRRESHAGGIRVVTTPRSGYGVQVSSFGSEKTARDEAARLLDRGFPAFVTLAVLPGSSWYRVCVGPFDTREEAQRYRSLFQETAGNEALIVDFGTR